VTDANSAFDQAKSDQEAAAAQAVALERAEIEAVARASAATEAAQAAAQLQAALDAATTKAQQNAAAEAAKVAAAAVAANAAAAANAATAAATSAQTASTTTFNSLTTENQNLASDYKLSNPAAIENSGTRSTRSMFTQAELAANPTLKTFVEQWDAFIDKQMEKFAALAKQAAKEAALLVAQQTETAIKAAADMAAAKAAAQAALNAANTEKTDKENARIAAELAALAKDTSLVSVIALSEMLYITQRLGAKYLRPWEVYFWAACGYLIIVIALSTVAGRLERRLAARE
jgi:hypothetical protein